MFKNKEKISLLLVTISVAIVTSNGKTCTFTFATNFPEKESVLLWNFDLLVEPENDAVVMNAGDTIIVACPGSKNTIVSTGTAFTSAKCVSGQTLKIGTKNYRLSDLGCSTSVTGEFQITTTKCGDGKGVIKNIGHKVENKFLTLFEVCYDNNRGEALYADHVIYGSTIDYAKSLSNRPSFKVGGVSAGVNPDSSYKQVTQKTTFTNSLGSSQLADQYIYSNSYLARGHLVPAADQVFITSSLSTYFYMNTIPQWQQINNGNWKSLESTVRNMASYLGEDFQVITGSHEVLELEDINGDLVEMYLSSDKLPVPKFVWKIAYSLDTQKGIAFVSLNNPFVTEVTEDHYLCTDICDSYGWGTSSWINPAKGLTYCCDIDELREVVPTIPELAVSDIQEGPPGFMKILNKFM